MFCLIVNINAQVITNTAVLSSVITQSDNTTLSTQIPIEVVRTNGRIAELRINISSVASNAKFVNLRVYELIYTTNIVETPIADSTTTGGSTNTGGTTGNTNTGGGTTNPTTPGGTTGGTTTPSNPPTAPTTVTNNVTLAVTIKKVDNTEQNINLPAQTIWSNNQLQNIVFDITSLPADAIIIRYRILDYIYDPNGNLIGPSSGTNDGGGTTTPPDNNGGGGAINPTPPPTDAVQFPVEVLGSDQHTEEFKFVLNDNLNNIYGAQFTIHGLGYTNKASVSINGSQWIPLNNRTVIFPRKFERLWTGIGGIQNTLTMVLPFASNNIIPSVTNTIKFKFNDTTKQSVGYRVLNADIVRREETSDREKTYAHGWDQPSPYKPTYITNVVYNYPAVKLSTTKTIDDPKNWTPKSSDPVVINQGKDLWFNGNIFEKGQPLKAKCSDCHFTDGYDLKYFNYSDKSIVARSKYHGLSEQQGLALASYIRSLNVPYQEKGRPWNPLYQPGPGMSKVPIDNWVAGAGMEWVLDDDIKSFKYIFPNGTQNGIVYNGVVQPIDFKKAYNINDIPIAMQLPDWNHWLPKVHLKDSAPEIWDWSLTKDGGSGRRFFDWFMNSIPKDQGMKGLVQIMRSHGEETGYQLVHMDQFFQKKYFDAGKQRHFMNNIRMAYRHWVTVRTLELMQRWKLQDLGHEILEDNANTRDQWGERGARAYIDLAKLDKIKAQFGSSYTNVFNDRRWYVNSWTFHLAPHIGSLSPVTDQNDPEFTYEPYGDQSSQWYQLQMYLDDSNRVPEVNIIDWGYIHNILYSSVSQWGAMVPYSLYTGKHTALQFMNTIKTYEAYQFNDSYKDLIEGIWSDEQPHIRLLGGTVLWGPVDSSQYRTYNEFTGHYIDAYGTKENRDMMVGALNQLYKAQLDRLIENPNAAVFNITVGSENMLRYMGGDPNLIKKFVDFRNKTWPDNGYVSKITHVWPAPFYQLN